MLFRNPGELFSFRLYLVVVASSRNHLADQNFVLPFRHLHFKRLRLEATTTSCLLEFTQVRPQVGDLLIGRFVQ